MSFENQRLDYKQESEKDGVDVKNGESREKNTEEDIKRRVAHAIHELVSRDIITQYSDFPVLKLSIERQGDALDSLQKILSKYLGDGRIPSDKIPEYRQEISELHERYFSGDKNESLDKDTKVKEAVPEKNEFASKAKIATEYGIFIDSPATRTFVAEIEKESESMNFDKVRSMILNSKKYRYTREYIKNESKYGSLDSILDKIYKLQKPSPEEMKVLGSYIDDVVRRETADDKFEIDRNKIAMEGIELELYNPSEKMAKERELERKQITALAALAFLSRQ
jgi:hypothetical protein